MCIKKVERVERENDKQLHSKCGVVDQVRALLRFYSVFSFCFFENRNKNLCL